MVLQHSDLFSEDKAIDKPELKVDGELLHLRFARADGEGIEPGSRIALRGSLEGNSIVVAPGSTRVLAAPSSKSVEPRASGPKRIAILLFNFSNDTSQPYTPAFAAGVAFNNPQSAATYYQESSWGTLSLSGDVHGWYTIPASDTTCEPLTWTDQANAAAAADGVDLASYDNIVYAFPQVGSCAFGGSALQPGSISWLNGSDMKWRTMAHELGHNFGTAHANSLQCNVNGTRVALSASPDDCSVSEYGDPFSIMGTGDTAQPTNFSRGNFGWLTPANTTTVNASGDYSIEPVEPSDPNGVKAVRIPHTPGHYLTLEYRRPYGTFFDAWSPSDPVVGGVTIRITSDYTVSEASLIVDATPQTFDGWTDGQLAPGKTLVDPSSGASITTLSAGPGGAQVHVSMPSSSSPPPPTGATAGTVSDKTRPTAPGKLKLRSMRGRHALLRWAASSDDLGVVGYLVSRNGRTIRTTDSLSCSVSVRRGRNIYRVIAFDAAGNHGAPSNRLSVSPRPAGEQ